MRQPVRGCKLGHVSPQPPKRRIKRRKTVSVTPARGPETVAGAILTGPISKLEGNFVIPSVFLYLASEVLETEIARRPSDTA